MNPPAKIPVTEFAKRNSFRACAAALGMVLVAACGKKEEPAPPPAPAPTPAPATPPAAPAPTEDPKTPPPAAPKTVDTPKAAAEPASPGMRDPQEAAKAPPAEPKAATAPRQRSPDDAAAWQRWDAAAERMRDVGATVRDSADPRRLEIVVGPLSDSEVRTLARSAYQTLGGGAVSVVLFDASGAQVGQATIEGVRGR